MASSVWPASPSVTARLRAFQASSFFPERYGARGYVPSEYWRSRARAIYVSPMRDAIAIDSLTHFHGPGERDVRRGQREARPRLHRAAEMLGARIPSRWWQLPNHIARRWLGMSAHLTLARDRARAVRAFEGMGRSGRSLGLEDLLSIPILADHFDMAPVLTLYVGAMLNALMPIVSREKPRLVLEIGPSEAVLAVCLHHLFGSRFVLVDLPELIPMSYTIVSHYLPDVTVALPHEVAAHPSPLDADFVFLAPEQMAAIPAESVDLAVNTSSFQEMSYPLIGQYFKEIERCVAPHGLFYCLNETCFTRHESGGPIEFARYPWSEAFNDLFYEPVPYWSLLGGWPRMHRLQRKESR